MIENKILYIANENGDWWALSPDDVIYVMHPDQTPTDASPNDDKFESVIMENGETLAGFYDALHATVFGDCS